MPVWVFTSARSALKSSSLNANSRAFGAFRLSGCGVSMSDGRASEELDAALHGGGGFGHELAIDLAGAHQQVEELMMLVRAQAGAQHAQQFFPALRAEARDNERSVGRKSRQQIPDGRELLDQA